MLAVEHVPDRASRRADPGTTRPGHPPTHAAKVKPELLADAPSQVWIWDITKLAGPIKGLWFHLYVLIDIYSRYTPGWMWMFCPRLSHSGKAVHIAYANQTQESFLDGHVRAFARLKGVPTGMIRYDNLKPAVIRVALGRERFEHPRFIAMRSHYGFDSFFYIPGIEGAHETSGVEGEIGRFRRRHLTPVPHLPSMAALNEALAAADAGNARHETAHDRLSALSLQCRIHAVEFPIRRDRGRRGGCNVREHPSNADRVGKTSCPDARILEHLYPSRLHRGPRMPGTRVDDNRAFRRAHAPGSTGNPYKLSSLGACSPAHPTQASPEGGRQA